MTQRSIVHLNKICSEASLCTNCLLALVFCMSAPSRLRKRRGMLSNVLLVLLLNLSSPLIYELLLLIHELMLLLLLLITVYTAASDQMCCCSSLCHCWSSMCFWCSFPVKLNCSEIDQISTAMGVPTYLPSYLFYCSQKCCCYCWLQEQLSITLAFGSQPNCPAGHAAHKMVLAASTAFCAFGQFVSVRFCSGRIHEMGERRSE